MEWRDLVQTFQRSFYGLIDTYTLPKCHATVHNTMSNGAHGSQIKSSEQFIERLSMIVDFLSLLLTPIHIFFGHLSFSRPIK